MRDKKVPDFMSVAGGYEDMQAELGLSQLHRRLGTSSSNARG